MRFAWRFVVVLFSSSLVLLPLWGNAQVVVPGVTATTEGTGDNCLPWTCFEPVRYQQVYSRTELPSGTITELWFRQDGFVGHGAFETTLPGVTIVLSSTTGAPDALSTTFSINLGLDATVVFSGDLTLSSAAGSDVPRPFDVAIPLTTPFVFDAGSGMNLLLDVTVPDTGFGHNLDSEPTGGDSVSRVMCHSDPVCSTTDTASYSDSNGLVTQFVYSSLIFFDGFESNDTSRWSGVVP